MALALAVDVSASVDFDEFGLMVGGLASAFRDEGVRAAATAGPRGAVAVAVLFWSEAQDVAVPWMRISGPEEADALARALEAAPRQPRAAATAIGEALVAALALLARCPAQAPRLVVDVSGDGSSNRGRAPGPVRDLGVAAGAVINGLAVVNEEADLLAHYERDVIGGTGSFAMECASYDDFAEAIRRKLLREMRGAPLTA
ncbi:DUF1194 domain-containing protein [Sabulicella rubraurantiaca]|uniref:DUF1194 domain-containing protein n=1 Tax=Sabulicella rubraurantiaca TaxID=2811429 RepID=UPI001F19CF00|nr:DUF1194 domain-containing protein [Sabulicella rubraurantiaca]